MAKTQQPVWEYIANLGDATPLDYGGYFVYRDTTDVYSEEAELLIPEDWEVEEEDELTYTIYRVLLDRLKLIDGYLVPIRYEPDWPHPVERYDEWFHDKLEDVASTMGTSEQELEKDFTSEDPLVRANAYRDIGEYFGWENLDSSPMTGVILDEVEKRYSMGELD